MSDVILCRVLIPGYKTPLPVKYNRHYGVTCVPYTCTNGDFHLLVQRLLTSESKLALRGKQLHFFSEELPIRFLEDLFFMGSEYIWPTSKPWEQAGLTTRQFWSNQHVD